MNPLIIYTPGDPAGLGPDLLFQTEASILAGGHSLLIVGPESILEHYCGVYNRQRFWERIEDPSQIPDKIPGIYLLQPPQLEGFTFRPGQGDRRCGFTAGSSLLTACDLISKGYARALVTGPVNKAFMLDAGFRFGGHTEFLADYFGIDPGDVCMHLCGENLRVSLVTTHPPLRQVADLITRQKIILCLRLTQDFIRKLGLETPLAVCGLNPHAGEQGKIGHEEETIIRPAIERAVDMGINVQGPFPADTVFSRAYQKEFSAVLAMYHDQGLGPLKLVEFGKCVNITLGLPIIRTSVDHGTGYDLAGTGRASPRSLERAFELAVKLVHEQRDE
ncbi:MAG: 4-hydroxythreonine-4-phosphate dehydrogenase PdxA [Desulfonatronovibrio sp.]